ncbi:hypothetical protein AB0J43_44175, partial [Nonomuraea fuscirosea]
MNVQSPADWPILLIAVIGSILLVEVLRRVLNRAGRKWALARHLVEHCTWPAFLMAAAVAANAAFGPG